MYFCRSICSDFPLLTARSRLPYRLIVLWIMLYERQLSLWLEYCAIQGIIIIKCSEIKSREPLFWVAHILDPLLEMEREAGMKTQIFQQSMACEVIQFHMPYKTIQSRCSVQFKTITGKTATRRKSFQQLSTQWHQKWGGKPTPPLPTLYPYLPLATSTTKPRWLRVHPVHLQRRQSHWSLTFIVSLIDLGGRRIKMSGGAE